MFGRRRGPSRFPAWLRLLIGALFFSIGALVLLMEAGLIGDPRDMVRENQMAGLVSGLAFAGVGALLILGVFTGVDDLGNRPAAMSLATRLLLDAVGYTFGFAFAAMLGFIAAVGDWGDTGVLPRIVFGAFAALVGGLMIYSLVRAFVRAIRGQPYDDGHRRNAPGE